MARAAEGLSREYSALKECKYQVKNVSVQTCGPLYSKWKSKKSLYKNAPLHGLNLDVEYADTGYSNSPVVLCLHGAPGTHGDFGLLMNHLSTKKVRVIAPNFPDYSLTEKTNFYRHTAEEKAEYLKDFLTAININEIDMLVSHSSAVYPGLNLWESESLKIKSIALINPSGHRRIKAMKPVWFIDNSVRAYLNPFGRWLYRKLGNKILSAKGVPVKINNIDNVLLSATTMFYSNVEKLEHHLHDIRNRGIPTLYVFSENDKLIEAKVFYEMASMLGVQQEDFTVFDKDGNLITKTLPKNNVTTLCFHSGGHYAFLKHAAIVNQWIDDLLFSVSGYDAKKIEDVKGKPFVEPPADIVKEEKNRIKIQSKQP
ncbi:DUF1057 domain containing protein-like protein [Leptotrombidium deliense]|uniref:DUF1057 domain containing protein-like protein n=1 Tax=Leptotrombidium deliense TaxID=299467 RepID=A0A443SHT7_9ACAR|nr:DUF1057 domain containing protein-like protein [Leptotrombidium deliense]